MTQERKSAVIFGAGKMACGLLGRLLFESGYQSIFISRRNDILESINRNHGYKVIVGTNESCRVRDATALHLNDLNEINKALSFADIVFTAVGVDNVSLLSPLIAAGLSLRQKINPGIVNIIASENLPGAGAYLRHQIMTHVPSDEAIIIGDTVGFSNALTHCIMTGGESRQGELSFQADSVGSLVINSQGLKGGLPQISHTSQTDCFDFAFKRKLYTINLAQAVAAYVGYQHNCQFIHEAALHPEVRPIIIGAVEDACSALQCEMPEERELIAQDAMLAIERISNPVLADHITRVTRDPQRKLAAQERLVGPARLAHRHGLRHETLDLAIAAALCYDNPGDAQATELQKRIADEGLDNVLTITCGLLPHEPLAQDIKRLCAEIRSPSKKNARGVQKIIAEVESELIRNHDAGKVKEVMSWVVNEYQSARILSYLPILLKRKVQAVLSHMKI